MFLWKNKQNYPLIFIKYVPYLFYWISMTMAFIYPKIPKFLDIKNIAVVTEIQTNSF